MSLAVSGYAELLNWHKRAGRFSVLLEAARSFSMEDWIVRDELSVEAYTEAINHSLEIGIETVHQVLL